MVASTANRLPEPSLFHGLERAPHDVRALANELLRDLYGHGPNGGDRIRHRLAVSPQTSEGSEPRGPLPSVFSRLVNSPPAPALPA